MERLKTFVKCSRCGKKTKDSINLQEYTINNRATEINLKGETIYHDIYAIVEFSPIRNNENKIQRWESLDQYNYCPKCMKELIITALTKDS